MQCNFDEASFHNTLKFEPDIDLYLKLEELNKYYFFTGRLDGKIVGYCAYFLSKLTHVSAKQAYQDFIYLMPEYRKTRNSLAYDMLFYAEMYFKSIGVNYIINTVALKVDSNYGKLLGRMGYEPMDILYGKKL